MDWMDKAAREIFETAHAMGYRKMPGVERLSRFLEQHESRSLDDKEDREAVAQALFDFLWGE